jgi:O-Antigen ligase
VGGLQARTAALVPEYVLHSRHTLTSVFSVTNIAGTEVGRRKESTSAPDQVGRRKESTSVLGQVGRRERSITVPGAVPEVRPRVDAGTRSRVALFAVIGVILVAPFERALFAVAGFTVTTIEAAIIAALCLVAVSVWRQPPLSAWFATKTALRPSAFFAQSAVPTSVLIAGAFFLLALVAATLAAPFAQGNSMRFTGRMVVASLVVIATAHTVDTLHRARAVVQAFLAVATIVAVIAVLELAQMAWVMSALTLFRPGFHVVGGQLRATSTLLYPTIASMYLELAFALGLWLLLAPVSDRPRFERTIIFVALVTIGAGIAATFTRAGLAGLASSLVVVGVIRLARLGPRRAGLGVLAGLGAVLGAVVVLLHSPELLATRLSSEGSRAWYGARYQVPSTLTLQTGRTHQIPITLSNTGRVTWDSKRYPAFHVAYHWLRSGSEAVIQFEGQRTPFPLPVPPGSTVSLQAYVTAPAQPGAYTLVWDVVLETRAWLSTEGVVPANTEVRVEGAASGRVQTVMPRLPRSTARPARLELWSAALAIAREYPWLGIGPDNYRFRYGQYLRTEARDDRVHANNMYLEVVTGAGVVGLAALLALVATTGVALWRRATRTPVTHLMPAVALFAAWLMVAGHGLVDSFLSFTPTYVMFAIVAGLAFSAGAAGASGAASASDAARGEQCA